MKITFVITSLYGVGGTIRTVVTLANHLAEAGHEVTIISLWRRRKTPFFELHPRIKVLALADTRALKRRRRGLKPRIANWAVEQPSRLMHKEDKTFQSFNLLTDLKLLREMRRLSTDVLITTRPAHSLFAARFAPRDVVRVAQEHNFLRSNLPGEQKDMQRLYQRLDAVVTLTPAHDADWEAFLPPGPTRRYVIPNSVDTSGSPLSTQENKLVVAVGRLVKVKRYDHLIKAFAMVVREHPDWSLRIYGSGETRPRLEQLILDLGMYNNIFLMGQQPNIDRAFAKASITAMSSESEGLPMTLIEAMLAGVPPVSYDCPHGPRSIITDGHDGLLVENSNPAALAEGIIELIRNEDRRREMSKAAIETARRYDTKVVGDRWIEVLQELVATKESARSRRPQGLARFARPRAGRSH